MLQVELMNVIQLFGISPVRVIVSDARCHGVHRPVQTIDVPAVRLRSAQLTVGRELVGQPCQEPESDGCDNGGHAAQAESDGQRWDEVVAKNLSHKDQ